MHPPVHSRLRRQYLLFIHLLGSFRCAADFTEGWNNLGALKGVPCLSYMTQGVGAAVVNKNMFNLTYSWSRGQIARQVTGRYGGLK